MFIKVRVKQADIFNHDNRLFNCYLHSGVFNEPLFDILFLIEFSFKFIFRTSQPEFTLL